MSPSMSWERMKSQSAIYLKGTWVNTPSHTVIHFPGGNAKQTGNFRAETWAAGKIRGDWSELMWGRVAALQAAGLTGMFQQLCLSQEILLQSSGTNSQDLYPGCTSCPPDPIHPQISDGRWTVCSGSSLFHFSLIQGSSYLFISSTSTSQLCSAFCFDIVPKSSSGVLPTWASKKQCTRGWSDLVFQRILSPFSLPSPSLENPIVHELVLLPNYTEVFA